MRKKITALLLTVMFIVSSLPVSVLADYGGNGTGGGNAGNIGAGQFSYDMTGYRMYLASKETGERVSDIVDWCVTNPITSGVFATGTKLDEGLTGKGNIHIVGLGDLKSIVGTMPQSPITFTGGRFVGNGVQFKNWILNGKSSLDESKVNVDFSSGYELQPSKEQTFPPDKGNEPITSTDVYATLEAIALNYLDTLYQLPHSEYNMSQYSAKAASGSTLQHLTNFINETAAQNALTSKQMQVYRAAVLLVYENVVLPAVDEYPVATEGTYGWYSSEVEKADSSSVEITGGSGGIQGGFGTGSAIDSDGTSELSLPVAFAAEEKKKTDPYSMPLGRIINLATGQEKYIFDTTKYGIELSTGPDGKLSVVQTASDHDLYFMVEPIFWLKTAHWSSATRSYCGGHSWFYGTPTNYAQWALAQTPSDPDDGFDGVCNGATGSESWYRRQIGNSLAQCLVLEGSQFTGAKTITPPTVNNDADFSWKNSDIANTKVGFALHAYYLKVQGGIPTQHTWNGDPEPGEVPDPDKIPVEQGEPTEPGDPITPEQWYDPENNPLGDPTRSNTTRTIKIVKVYQFEDKYGNLYHEVTYHTDGNPGTIAIQNEPGYKVAEYFTSPDYYEWVDLAVGEDGKFIKNGDAYTRNDGTSSAITPDTPWSSFYNPSLIEIPTGQIDFVEDKYT